MTSPQYIILDCVHILGAGMVAVVANAMTPGQPDMIASIGAMLASVIAVIEARKKDRTYGNIVSVFIGSAVVGSFTPGIFFCNVFPSLAERFTWHAWAGAGFFVGLIGWSVVLTAIKIFDRRKAAAIEALADKWGMPRPRPPQDEPPPPGT